MSQFGNVLWAVGLFALVAPIVGRADGGQSAGNGGDQIRLRFENGRKLAESRVHRLTYCGFLPTVPYDVKGWILEHREALAEDIARSKHVWITDPQPTCAWTQTSPAFDVSLSFERCRATTQDEAQAAALLVHESVHHFGVADETFADQVAFAVSTSNLEIPCSPVPADPFSDSACPGQALDYDGIVALIPRGLDHKDIGHFTGVSQSRPCNQQTGCGDWENSLSTTLPLFTSTGGIPGWGLREKNPVRTSGLGVLGVSGTSGLYFKFVFEGDPASGSTINQGRATFASCYLEKSKPEWYCRMETLDGSQAGYFLSERTYPDGPVMPDDLLPVEGTIKVTSGCINYQTGNQVWKGPQKQRFGVVLRF